MGARMCQDVPGLCQDEIEIVDWPVPGLIYPGTKTICRYGQIFYVPGQNYQSLITLAKPAKFFETLSNPGASISFQSYRSRVSKPVPFLSYRGSQRQGR